MTTMQDRPVLAEQVRPVMPASHVEVPGDSGGAAGDETLDDAGADVHETDAGDRVDGEPLDDGNDGALRHRRKQTGVQESDEGWGRRASRAAPDWKPPNRTTAARAARGPDTTERTPPPPTPRPHSAAAHASTTGTPTPRVEPDRS